MSSRRGQRKGHESKEDLKKKIIDLRQSLDTLRQQINKIQKELHTYENTDEQSLVVLAQGESGGKPEVDGDSQFSIRSRRILRGHYGKIYAMQWQNTESPTEASHHLVSASQDGKLIVWNGRTTNKSRMIGLKSSWVMTCAYAPSGKFVACGGLDNLCTIFDLKKTSAQDATVPGIELRSHEGYLSSCRFVNDGQILTSSGDSTCILWDIEQQKAVTNFSSHDSDVMSVSLNPVHPDRFVSGSCDTAAKIHSINTGECEGTFRGHEADINTVEWFPDGNAFASGSDDSTLKLFDQRAYRRLSSYSVPQSVSGVTSLCFSLTGKYLFAGYDENPYAAVWDTLTAQKLQVFQSLGKRVSCVGMQSHGYALCTGSWDYNLRIWA